MRRRTLVILCHWGLVLLLLAIIKGGAAAPGARWAFVGIGVLWLAGALVNGVLARPGPKLTGLFRRSFVALHVGLYLLIAVSVGLNLAGLWGLVPLGWAWNSLLVLLTAGIFHGIFHLWRHTALNDGALRMIFPRAWHKHL